MKVNNQQYCNSGEKKNVHYRIFDKRANIFAWPTFEICFLIVDYRDPEKGRLTSPHEEDQQQQQAGTGLQKVAFHFYLHPVNKSFPDQKKRHGIMNELLNVVIAIYSFSWLTNTYFFFLQVSFPSRGTGRMTRFEFYVHICIPDCDCVPESRKASRDF